MTLLPHQLELLAPARTADIGKAAVLHGADAVYIGGPSFGARAAADNPVSDIAALADYAHRFQSRVFVTLNTILRDDELEPARRLAWQLYDAGVDALIIQDMGLLELDLPPIALHASTQCDIRTPEKARFLQDVGLSQLVLARELDLAQIAAIRAATDPTRCTLEFFVHGALCVAYSGQCYISAAHTGRSANRGECNQACRLPYQVIDAAGRFVAHDRHVLSMKDNNQSANLAALVDAGIRSFKIEGRYKDLGYVKNITAHYRRLLDALIEQRQDSAQPLAKASSGTVYLGFEPDPDQHFNRDFTDYFVNGRRDDIGAFDTPKNAGRPIGHVSRALPDALELTLDDPALRLSNGDGLCYFDQQKNLVGLAINRAECLDAAKGLWRVVPKDALVTLPDLRRGRIIHRNRDQAWLRRMEHAQTQRRIRVWMQLRLGAEDVSLTLTDEDGIQAQVTHAWPAAQRALMDAPVDATTLQDQASAQLTRLGTTIFEAASAVLDCPKGQKLPKVLPASKLNALRRDAVDALLAARRAAWQRPARAAAVEPPVPYPQDHLSYLGNVFNSAAHRFYQRHGVRVIEPAFEAIETTGEVSLMITKHCVRYALSLCPKQAKGVTGVQGTVRAEPLQLVNGSERLTLRFDCKPCEMHVVGRIKPAVARQSRQALAQVGAVPMRFFARRPNRS
ncbi:MAG: 23S rRNA 5-hydroxycytidine C2501 synthase [Rhodoferax sp.]